MFDKLKRNIIEVVTSRIISSNQESYEVIPNNMVDLNKEAVVDFGSVPGFTVGKANTNFSITCSAGLDSVDTTQSTDWSNKDSVIDRLKRKGGWYLQYASDLLKDDEEVAMIAVSVDGEALNFVSDRLKGVEKVVLASLGNGWIFPLAADELRNSRDFVIKAIEKNWEVFEYLNDEHKADYEIICKAIKQNGHAFEFAADSYKNDKKILIEFLEIDKKTFLYASEDLKCDKDVLNSIRDYLMSDKWRNLAQIQQVEFIDLKEKLIKYDREDELNKKLSDLDKVQAEQQNSINQPKAEIKSRRKI